MNNEYMKIAYELATKAYLENEIPVGAVIVKDDEIIGCGYNKKEQLDNPLKHAELIAIEEACSNIGDWRLNGCVLYVTLEPCDMCMGAVDESRIEKVYYLLEKNEHSFDNKKVKIDDFELENRALDLLQKFFKNRRNK